MKCTLNPLLRHKEYTLLIQDGADWVETHSGQWPYIIIMVQDALAAGHIVKIQQTG